MSSGQPGTINDVLDRMKAIDSALPAADGVACFNRMYLQVTEEVQQKVQAGMFANPTWVSRLDVVFAGFYFEAVDTLDGPLSGVPVAWRPLAESRRNPGVESIQFALAGMNAHINHDLPLAVVATCAGLDTAPDAGSNHADYQQVDSLLDAVEQSVREAFEPPDVQGVDRHVAGVLDLIANWSITSARDVAWDTGLALWAVRDNQLACGLLAGALARTVAMASRCLLVAV